MTKIEIKWEGPYTIAEIELLSNYGKDHGLYQIYGTHPIFGPKSLVYIGKADAQTFGARIPQHNDYVYWEYPEYEFYIGRLGGIENIDGDNWSKQIDLAERILINYCQLPYNSQNINNHGISNDNEIIVLNYGKRFRLPAEVSTMWKEFYEVSTIFIEPSEQWKLFTNEK